LTIEIIISVAFGAKSVSLIAWSKVNPHFGLACQVYCVGNRQLNTENGLGIFTEQRFLSKHSQQKNISIDSLSEGTMPT
jgi:hypothetical protein